ncbi:HAMP domain-containing protein [Allosaccharopolyspora coralli]|uniref:histidine kinase n=1 Tax=Allosaccharopolyspora coralli TaxID=2665642 RepID=A0A5Q3Q956_9PSEU|nr:nitrate- and nitrite sensing domain-containing protein [Allosaccharopolyspora coralli]QGK71211.1 HAMP domain-containing protein [Allosaccharopolyspora coralli]
MSRTDDSATDAPRSSRWATITHWRNWRLVTKLAAVVLVPAVFALTLGVLQVQEQVADSAEYARSDHAVQAATALRATIGTLQEERSSAAEYLAQGNVSAPKLQQEFATTDRQNATSADRFREHIDRDPVVGFNHENAQEQLDEARALRGDILAGTADPVVVIDTYSEASRALLALDRALTVQVASPTLNSTSNASHALAQIGEELSLQQALVLVGVLRDSLTSQSKRSLESSEVRRVAATAEFRSVATEAQRAEFDDIISSATSASRDRSLQLAMGAPGEDISDGLSPLMVSATMWNDQSQSAVDSILEFQFRLDSNLHRTAFQLSERASNLAGAHAVILLSALAVAALIIVLIGRQLLGSLDLLRRAALMTAHKQLPQAVSRIRAGEQVRADMERVPVHTTEEVGQLARAFDAVQNQAVELASEQAELRKAYSDSFVNVSRRSQSLLERQLRLFEALERDEEDPDHLATLFQLDHLATRMRRNNENLMVLSGSELARRFTRSTKPADLIRAAVSEIEHYPRVVVHPMPNVQVVGYACSDLVRLFAELLDNAANFSPPNTSVTVTGRYGDDGSLAIDIVDEGFGMREAEIAATNHRIRTDHESEASTSRRMGLFVVAQLRARHDIRCQLHPGRDGRGIRATTAIRAEMLVPESGDSYTRTNKRTGDNARPPSTMSDRDADTLLTSFDWEAAEQDANTRNGVTRNGFSLPPGVTIPDQVRDESSRDGSMTDAVEAGESFASHGLFERGDENTSVPSRRPSAFEEPAESSASGRDSTESEPPSPGSDDEDETPIFDDLASAWFQVSRPTNPADRRWPAKPAGSDSKGTFQSPMTERFPSSHHDTSEDGTAHWDFATDAHQARAEDVSRTEPAEFTEAGLPRRNPQAHLLAGSAQLDDDRPRYRDATITRNRLASFQNGAHRARHRLEPERSGAAPGRPTSTLAPTVQTVTERRLADEAELEFTEAGLPRRVPRTHVIPESEADSAPAIDRSPELVRGRLAGFQRGARQGRHTLAEPPTEEPDDQR